MTKVIIDVSNVIYGGHNGQDRRISGFPVGGIRKLIGLINANIGNSDIALCFDGGDIIKKELLPTYKAGRVPDYSVYAQIDYLKEVLLDCNIPFYCNPKYEADDYIYSLCQLFTRLGDYDGIEIYSDDEDLACCVTDNIEIHNNTSNGKCITKSTYEDKLSFKYKGVNAHRVVHNTVLLDKLFYGDNSDNYSGVRVSGLTYNSLANSVLEAIQPFIDSKQFSILDCSNYDVFSTILSSLDGLVSEEETKEVLALSRIVFPYDIDVTTNGMDALKEDIAQGLPLYKQEQNNLKTFNVGNINVAKLGFYSSLLGLKKCSGNTSVNTDSAEAQAFYSELMRRAKELSSGTLAVDRYRKKKEQNVHSSTLVDMSLPS